VVRIHVLVRSQRCHFEVGSRHTSSSQVVRFSSV